MSHSAISNNKNYNQDRRKGDKMMIKGKNKNYKLTKENKKSWKKSKDLTKNFLQLKNKYHYIAIKKGNTKEPKKFPFQIPNLQVSRESKLYPLFFLVKSPKRDLINIGNKQRISTICLLKENHYINNHMKKIHKIN